MLLVSQLRELFLLDYLKLVVQQVMVVTEDWLKVLHYANGSSAYRFAGPGSLNTDDNPTLYFHRGFTYTLENSTGSNHPFELRLSDGGSAYAPGGSFLTGSTSGIQTLTVPFDAPSSIVYQCTNHSGMLGTINFVS